MTRKSPPVLDEAHDGQCRARLGDGKRCGQQVPADVAVCRMHGGEGRPVLHGAYSRRLRSLPRLGEIMDEAAELSLPERAMEIMTLQEAALALATAAREPGESPVEYLERVQRGAYQAQKAHTELAKQARFWSEAWARRAIDGTMQHVVNVLRMELTPDQEARVMRRLRGVVAKLQ